MVLKDEVINAFTTLGLEPDAEHSVASTAYKKAALKHHPDRNHGDASAKERFQEIGHAWSICQRHYDNPRSSEKGAFGGFGGGRRSYSYEEDDDEDDMDDDERDEFFAWLFAEMMFNRYSHSSGRQYRREHAGHGHGGPRVYTFPREYPSYGPSYTTFSNGPRYQSSSYNPTVSQKKQNAEFEKRVREFEREQAEEEAQIKNAEREAHSSQMRLASHQDRAFNLGKEGKGSEMRTVIEQHDLDVTKPRNLKLKKQAKQPDQSANFETMLHVAAVSCDASLVDWLIQRGADAAALDPSRHTPFHVSILKGNIPVARLFLSLYRDTKTTDPRYPSIREGCHPSKASKDTQSNTPLQMAIKCGKFELVELLLKDATVHDVEKCWTLLQPDDAGDREVRELLLTKNGFSPPEDLPKQGLSKKAALKLQKQEEERRAAEEKSRRLAEEEANRLAKQARREKAQKEEAERKAKREAEEARIRAEEAAETLRIEAEQAKIRVAEEAERKRVEAEQARIRTVEEAARKRAEEEESKREKALEQQRKAEEEKQRRQAKEQERILRDLEAKRKANEDRRKAEKALRTAEKAEQAAAQQKEREQAARREAEAQAQAEADQVRLAQMAQQEEEERLKNEESKRDQQQKDTGQARLDAAMRRRAEQSARDKARAQRVREERAQAKASAKPTVTAVPTPPTPPTETKRKREARPLPRLRSNIPASAAPGVTTSRPPLVPLSPPMTPEDLQTMPIPDDLFRYEPPKPSSQEAVLVRATPSPSPSVAERRTTIPSRGRGPRRRDEPRNVPQSPATPSPSTTGDETPHRGNGVACRFFFGLGMKKGCKRGNECAFSHVPVPPRPSHTARRNALEEELARKNLELERIRAELAATQSSGP